MTNVMTHGDFADLTGALAIDNFLGMYESIPEEWPMLFERETAPKRREAFDKMMFDLDVAQEKPSGTPFVFDSAGELYKKQYEFKEYGIAFAITRAAREDSDHMSLIPKLSKSAARGMKEAKEIFHANILSRAFSGSYLGADGVALCSASHPVYGGALQSNLLTQAQLSEAGLEAGCIAIRTAKNKRNTGRIALKVKQLVIPPQLEYTAVRILKSQLQSGSAQNDTNALRVLGAIPKVVVITRLTSETAYFLQTDVMGGLKHLMRWPVRYETQPDFHTSNFMYKWEERYDAGWTDFLGIYGNQG